MNACDPDGQSFSLYVDFMTTATDETITAEATATATYIKYCYLYQI